MSPHLPVVSGRQVLRIVLLVLLALLPRSAIHAADAFQDCPADCPRLVAIPAGSFLMGSPASEPGRFDSEGPQHRVAVKPFALAIDEVTVDQFLAFLRATGYQPPPCDQRLLFGWDSPGHGRAFSPALVGPPTEPAICLNWDDAQAYIAWLDRASGRDYRLPSEAEWEYAARAGTTTARWWGAAIGKGHANCDGCGSPWDNHDVAPAGSFPPNPWGLDDMLGNVWQWVADCWHENYVGAPADGSAWVTGGDCSLRVMRGGSWDNVPVFVRAAARSRGRQAGGDFDYASYVGFRLARSLP